MLWKILKSFFVVCIWALVIVACALGWITLFPDVFKRGFTWRIFRADVLDAGDWR